MKHRQPGEVVLVLRHRGAVPSLGDLKKPTTACRAARAVNGLREPNEYRAGQVILGKQECAEGGRRVAIRAGRALP
jgi:hypothetical protein